MQHTAFGTRTRDSLPMLAQPMARRHFTRYALFSLLGAAVATSAVATAKALYPTKVAGFGTKVVVGPVTEVREALGHQAYLRNDAGRFYLLPATETTAIAVYWKCVHLGCTVPPPSPTLDGNIQCNCHGSQYSGKTGDLLKGPATHPLDYFSITIEAGNVVVDTTRVMPRTAFAPEQATRLG